MAERTVSVALQAKVSGFVSGMKTAAKSAQDFTTKVEKGALKNREHINTLSTSMGIVGASLVGVAAIAVKSFADFDAAMSSVESATHETAGNMDLLREAAIKAGADTAFSATEAANAIEELAKAGVSTKDILGGGLQGALDLAAAGQLEVADAAEIAATALVQFNLSGEQVPHVADLLAAGAGKAQGSVQDMAMALKQGGLVASQAGLSIEETTGTLSAFASAGLIGSDAGTSFKTMLLRLMNPSAQAAAAMENLGISAYDANGNMVSMASLAGQLEAALAPLPQAQRDTALATIFGSDAIRAATVLYKQGSDGIQEWTGKVNEQGYAAETAALKMNNLKGDIELLTGSLETAFVQMGEGADGPLRGIVQGLTDVVDAFGELPAGAQAATLALVGGGGLALLGAAGMAQLVVKIAETKEALSALGIAGGKAGKALKFAGAAAGVAALGLTILALSDYISQVQVDSGKLNRSLQAWANDGKLAGEALKLLGEDFSELDTAVARLTDKGGTFGERFWTSLINPGLNPMKEAKSRLHELDESLANLASSGSGDAAAEMFAQITQRLRDQGLSVKEIKQLFPEYDEALRAGAGANSDLSGKVQENADALGEQTEKLTPAAQALQEMEDRAKDLKEALDVLNATLGNLDAESAYEAAIDDAAARVEEFRQEQKEGADSVKGMKGALDLGTEAGRNNASALRDLWRRTSDYATQIKETTGDQGRANSVLGAGRKQLVDVAAQFLGSKRAAERYVDEILGIPKDVSTKYRTPGADSAISKGREVNRQADRANRTVTTYFNAVETRSYQRAKSQSVIQRYGRRQPAAGGPVSDYLPIVPMATGGFAGSVVGPGTGTSDTAGLFALSNGEFVVKASAVDKYGVDFMQALNNGAVGMAASGGLVRSGAHTSGSVTNVNVTFSGPVGNRQELENWLIQGLQRAARKGRVSNVVVRG